MKQLVKRVLIVTGSWAIEAAGDLKKRLETLGRSMIDTAKRIG